MLVKTKFNIGQLLFSKGYMPVFDLIGVDEYVEKETAFIITKMTRVDSKKYSYILYCQTTGSYSEWIQDETSMEYVFDT